MRYPMFRLMPLGSLFALLVLLSCGASDSQAPTPAPEPRFATAPTWADEFTTPGLPDTTKWTYDVGGSGWGNNELQYYTQRRAENARVADCALIIEARREQLPGTNRNYTSARLLTKGKQEQTYGAWEIRAKLPQGRGTWPAIWMLAARQNYGTAYWPDNGEIDIMEHVGFQPGRIYATVHTRAYNHMQRTHVSDSTEIPTFASDYHTYRLEWSPNVLHVLVDGRRVFTFRKQAGDDWRQWPYDKPFFLLLNIAVGGNWGGRYGVDDNIFPQRMQVDYVRFYPLLP